MDGFFVDTYAGTAPKTGVFADKKC